MTQLSTQGLWLGYQSDPVRISSPAGGLSSKYGLLWLPKNQDGDRRNAKLEASTPTTNQCVMSQWVCTSQSLQYLRGHTGGVFPVGFKCSAGSVEFYWGSRCTQPRNRFSTQLFLRPPDWKKRWFNMNKEVFLQQCFTFKASQCLKGLNSSLFR